MRLVVPFIYNINFKCFFKALFRKASCFKNAVARRLLTRDCSSSSGNSSNGKAAVLVVVGQY